jgi:hypothetical protein
MARFVENYSHLLLSLLIYDLGISKKTIKISLWFINKIMKIGTTKTKAAKFIIILNIKNIVRPESSLTIILSLFPYNRALESKDSPYSLRLDL